MTQCFILIFSALYSVDGDETDEDVESGVEALEDSWEDASCVLRPPSSPLGTVVSSMHLKKGQSHDTSFKSILLCHKYDVFLYI